MDIKELFYGVTDGFSEEEKYILCSKGIADFRNYCFKSDKENKFHVEVVKDVPDIDDLILRQIKDDHKEGNLIYLSESKRYREENSDKFDLIPYVKIERQIYDKFYKPSGNEDFVVLDPKTLSGEDCFMAYKFLSAVQKNVKFEIKPGTKSKIKKEFEEEYSKFLYDLKASTNYMTDNEMNAKAIELTNRTKEKLTCRISNKRVSNFETMPEVISKYMNVYRNMYIK